MSNAESTRHTKLSVVIPCYNEERTLERCVARLLRIEDASLSLEVIIVDDGSTDGCWKIIESLAESRPQIVALRHEKNRGKGAALATGFKRATGQYVAIQDADLEYDPSDLKRLLPLLVNDEADVVFGSRFLSAGAHRVLYFWHYVGNRLLTFISNMFSDLNLTDMEACYKVFRREIIQSIQIKEKRFGVEPEIVAKVAQLRPRIFEAGISYHGRTYEEGKKIGYRDGLRALYCIFHYNGPKAPAPIQLLIYLFVGGTSAIFNLLFFLLLLSSGLAVNAAVVAAFAAAAVVNYLLCIALLFRHKARWRTRTELLVYAVVVCLGGVLDFVFTKLLLSAGHAPWICKAAASMCVFVFNYWGRKYMVFPEPPAGPWTPQETAAKPGPAKAGIDGQ